MKIKNVKWLKLVYYIVESVLLTFFIFSGIFILDHYNMCLKKDFSKP